MRMTAILAATSALLLRSLTPSVAANTQTAKCDASHTLRVLFVGNSFTYVQNVPHLVHEIADALPGPCIQTDMIAVGGATLEDQWKSDSVAVRIRNGQWTHVVLNDQSTFGDSWWLNGKPRVGGTGSELAQYGTLFATAIKQAGAKPVFLAHWSNDGAPERDQLALDFIFADAARKTQSDFVPAGRAIKRMQQQMRGLTPYFEDGHHLSSAGAYMEALTIYSTLTKRPAAGAPSVIHGPAVEFNRGIVYPDSIIELVGLSTDDAAKIQRTAWAIYSENLNWARSITEPPPLSAEFPKLTGRGDAVTRAGLAGHWKGKTAVLPNPANDSSVIELSFADDAAHPDSVHIYSDLHFVGVAILHIEGDQVIVTASITANPPSSRGHPEPLQLELRGVLQNGALKGIATVTQRVTGISGSFNAIGGFELHR